MSEDNNPSFWTTLPGIIAAISALIASVTGLILAFEKINQGNTQTGSGTEMNSSSVHSPSEMVPIRGGEFWIGSDNGEKDEQPKHKVLVDAFSIEKYEVTQVQFEKVMGTTPSEFKGTAFPVENVTWQEAKLYCEKLGRRLPTEAEWEKAARADTYTKYHNKNRSLVKIARLYIPRPKIYWHLREFI